ncbi:MAG: T9SS type A sorting domain-containing protein [Bacteroidota bacterium]
MKNALFLAVAFLFAYALNAAEPSLTIKDPKANSTYRVGQTIAITWDTLTKSGERTWGKTFEFKWSESPNGPWNLLALAKNAKSYKDVTSSNPNAASGRTVITLPRKPQVWIKMNEVDNENLYGIQGPINVYTPPPATADSLIGGILTNTITLSASKIYQLKKVLYVEDGATLRIDPGTVILGDPNDVSAIVIKRGGKIYAKGTPTKPIVMTSGFAPGNRDRGDWGGLIIAGKASTNLGEAAIEGGLDVKYGPIGGVADDNDSSGVVQYVRIEFAGIAESPDNELNSLTMGGVGRRTVISHVMVSYAGDDAFEWFGGTVNAKYLISYNTIDDDMDTDNGFRGKVQHALIVRFPDIADQSNSEAFESDNDSKSSYNTPYTNPIFSNITVVGPLADTSWTVGTGANKYHSKHLTAVQIRRNSRMNLVNSVIMGYNAGVELTNNNTVLAASNDSIMVRFNDFYGIKNNKFFYFGSGTNPQGNVDANWLAKTEYGNRFMNQAGPVAAYAKVPGAFPGTTAVFNPLPEPNADYLNNANWAASNAAITLNDPFFDKVSYRGAFNTERWDLPWAEYSPVNKVYTSINDDYSTTLVPQFKAEAAPLPANDYTVVTYVLPESGNTTVRIVDATGSVKSIFFENQFQNAGTHQFMLNSSQLSTGVYYLQIVTAKGIYTINIPVVK